MRHLPIALLTILLLSCGKTDNTKEKGWEYLAASRQAYITGQYQQAEAFIDSLRQKCPKAIDARKDAIILLDFERKLQYDIKNKDK